MAEFRRIFAMVVVVLVEICKSEKHVRLVPEYFEVWSDNEYLNTTHAIDDSVPYLNFTHKVLKTIPDLEAHIESEVKSKNNPNHFFKWNGTFSVCDLLQMRAAHPMAALAFATVKRYGHLPDKCPIEKGTYRLTKIWPPEDNIPTSVPTIEGALMMQLFAVDNGERHMILSHKLRGHSVLKEGGAGKSFLSSVLKG